MHTSLKTTLAAALTLAALAACSDSHDIASPTTRGLTPRSIASHAIETSSASLALLSFEVHSRSLPSTFLYDVPLTNGSTSANLTIPTGEGYDIVVRGYDRYGVQTHQGTMGLASVAVGSNPVTGIALNPVVDGVSSAKVSVGIVGESRVEVGARVVMKAPSSINQGASVTLSAQAYTAEGVAVELKPGELHWAVSDPRGGTVMADPVNPRTAVFTANQPLSANIDIILQWKNSGGVHVPVTINSDPVVKLSAGFDFTCGLRQAGELYCWGTNSEQEMGVVTAAATCDGSYTCAKVPVRIASPRLFTDVAAGRTHACAIESGTGDTYCWGANSGGELGLGTVTTAELPTRMPTTLKFQQLAAGASFTCGLSSGVAYCWGSNYNGLMATGAYGPSTTPSPTPQRISSLSGWTQIVAGEQVACGVIGGVAKCWGGGSYNWDLGAGSNAVPGVVQNVTPTWGTGSVVSLTSSSTGSTPCAFVQGAGVWCWGYYNTPNGRSDVPVQVTGVTYTQLSTAWLQACGLDASGKAYCWGDNTYAELGLPTSTSFTLTPTAVQTTATFSSIVTGGRMTCGITVFPFSHVLCWGSNKMAQLGDNAIDQYVNTPTPTAVWGM